MYRGHEGIVAGDPSLEAGTCIVALHIWVDQETKIQTGGRATLYHTRPTSMALNLPMMPHIQKIPHAPYTGTPVRDHVFEYRMTFHIQTMAQLEIQLGSFFFPFHRASLILLSVLCLFQSTDSFCSSTFFPRCVFSVSRLCATQNFLTPCIEQLQRQKTL